MQVSVIPIYVGTIRPSACGGCARISEISEKRGLHEERRRPPPKLHGAGTAAVSFRVGACDAALARRPLAEIAADNFFPIIGIRAMVNRERVRQSAAGPLIAAETTQKFGENAIPA
jgi:hypothetical protein